MKKVFFISQNDKVNKTYSQDLMRIFDGYIDLKSYSLDEDCNDRQHSLIKPDIAAADLTIVSLESMINDVKETIGLGKKVDFLRFSFQKNNLHKLALIPKGSNILVCFYIYHNALQASSALCESGFRDFNLFPHGLNSELCNIKEFDYAITFGQADSVPTQIKNIVDLGYRKISFSKLINIALKLDILTKVIEKRIWEYSDNTPYENLGIQHFYKQSSTAQSQLKSIIDTIDYGVLICDEKYKITDINDNFFKILNITQGNYINQNIFNIILSKEICNAILTEETIENKLFFVEKLDKNILISKVMANEQCFVIMVKDITDIMNLERRLRREISHKGHVAKYVFSDIIGQSEAIKTIIKKAEKISSIDKPTLILGESGTGKELFAQSIHNSSKRRNFPFVAINCAAISTSLLESELFGYEYGSFTGSKKGGKEGVFELAHMGTLFLDEICEMPLEVQAKLLRALAEKEIMRVGATSIIKVDTRVIAATHQDIKELVKQGKFRLDLYYRLNVLTLTIPPLRERITDIPVIIKHILQKESIKLNISDNIMELLMRCEWDGNVRELINCIEYMAYTSDGDITRQNLPDYVDFSVFDTSDSTFDSVVTMEDEKLIENILSILKREKAGRRKLIIALKNQGLTISDYKMRNMLNYLRKNGYIVFSSGREGIGLTEKGCNYLNTLKINIMHL